MQTTPAPTLPSIYGPTGQAPAAKAMRPAEPPAITNALKRYGMLYLFLALPLAFLFIFNYWPMFGAQIAFRNYNPVGGIWHSPWVGLYQFQQFFSSPEAWQIVKNTLVLSVYYLLVGTPFTILLAICINEVRHTRLRRVIQTITYAPYFISTVVVVGLIDIVLSPTTGLLSQLAGLFHVHNIPDLLGSPGDFPSIYVWSGVWQESGYGAILYLAALTSISPSLYESAFLDGASRLQKIRYIDIPSLLPTIVVLLVLSVGNILSVGFEKVYLLQNPLNLSTSEIISTYVYKTGLLNANFSQAAAIGLFNSVVGLTLLVLTNTIARRLTGHSMF
jgi:putative aldouronate transport system permease protein